MLGQANGVWYRDPNKRFMVQLHLQAKKADLLQAIKDADTYLKSIDNETFSWLEKGNDLIGKDFLQQLKAI